MGMQRCDAATSGRSLRRDGGLLRGCRACSVSGIEQGARI